MKWFKNAGCDDADDSPRLLSLSPLRHCDLDQKPAATNGGPSSIARIAALPSPSSVTLADVVSSNRIRRRSPCHFGSSLFVRSPAGARKCYDEDDARQATDATNYTPPTVSSCPTQSKRLPNCYDVQQGRIVEHQRSNRLFASPHCRTKIRSPISNSVFHLPPTSPKHRTLEHPSRHIWYDTPRPLSSTRLSYAASPEPRDTHNLHKSLDDLLMASAPQSNASENLDDGHRGCPMVRTKSTDILCESEPRMAKKAPNNCGFSARIKNMSARTQQIFQRLYTHSGDSSDASNEHSRRPKHRSRLAMGSIYRENRSMSQGNMLDAVDSEYHDVNGSTDTLSPSSLFYLPLDAKCSPSVVEQTIDLAPDDSDSGILINESGQSSIVDVHAEFSGIDSTRTSIRSLAITEDPRITTDVDLNEFVATAFKIDGNSVPTTTSSRSKGTIPHLTISEPCSPMTKDPPPTRRINQFQKNTSSYSSMSGKLFRRSMSGKQFESLDNTRNASPTVPASGFIHNLCDDEKLRLNRLGASTLSIDPSHPEFSSLASSPPIAIDARFSTLPRRPKTAQCSFHTIVLEKGPGKKSLGFTIVGGTDSPKGALGIFIKTILPVGQAADDGRLRAGDEILAVNGEVLHDLSHHEAVLLFKSIRSGEVVLNLCRRVKQAPAKKCETFIDYI